MNLVVAAHPDDEVIGLGGLLPLLRDCLFIHVTDGAPRDMQDAQRLGFVSRESYAAARREESLAALSLAGIPAGQCRQLGFVDQEAAFHLAEIARALAEVIREIEPGFVATHPYEGGHPDHDSTAFGCYAARRLLMRQGICPGLAVEFASYHSSQDGVVAGDFLPDASTHVITVDLSPGRQSLKQSLFDCFQTQREVLSGFQLNVERFRIAPQYEFRTPPHEGPLHYENFSWGVDGEQWRTGARVAMEALGLL